jgi:polyhydroxyalkanoate synthesis repressor PhaR
MKTIKRYPNRKLYDMGESRYITLEEIAAFLRGGGEVKVVDSRTGEDITHVTLAQVLVGEEKRSRPLLPGQRIVTLLQTSGEFLKGKLAPVANMRDEAERTVQRLIQTEAEEVRDFLMGTQKAYEDFQRRADERFQTVLGAVKVIGPVHKEVERLRRQVDDLARRVEALEGGQAAPGDAATSATGARKPAARRRAQA